MIFELLENLETSINVELKIDIYISIFYLMLKTSFYHMDINEITKTFKYLNLDSSTKFLKIEVDVPLLELLDTKLILDDGDQLLDSFSTNEKMKVSKKVPKLSIFLD